MKRAFAFVLGIVVAFSMIGCAKKTASEELQDGMRKAGDQMKREADAWK